MVLRQAIDSILEPKFNEYNGPRKQPTKKAIDRLTEQDESPIANSQSERIVYLVEIRFGSLHALTADYDNKTFPAAKNIYMSQNGYIHTSLIKAEITDSGDLTPVKDPQPHTTRPIENGRQATQSEYEKYKNVLKTAHGLKFNTNK